MIWVINELPQLRSLLENERCTTTSLQASLNGKLRWASPEVRDRTSVQVRGDDYPQSMPGDRSGL
jgi:hypothetical protein